MRSVPSLLGFGAQIECVPCRIAYFTGALFWSRKSPLQDTRNQSLGFFRYQKLFGASEYAISYSFQLSKVKDPNTKPWSL